MRLLVFGSTGGTGRELVRQALEHGHEVTAFARRPKVLRITHERLRLVQGDALDAASVERAAKGQEAVLSALGPRLIGNPTTLLSQSARVIITAMQKHGVRRLVVESSLGVGASEGHMGRFFSWIVVPLLLRHIYADKELQERVIARSALDWTIVRPAILTNRPRTGRYRVWRDVAPTPRLACISRADVADCMLSVLVNRKTYKRAINCSY